MGYFYTLLVPASLSLMRIFQKAYTKRTAETKGALNVFLLFTCIIALAFFAIMDKGQMKPNGITMLFAVFMAVLAAASNILLLAAMNYTDLTNIAVFNGAGGIIIPVLYGKIFLNEALGTYKIIAVLLLLLTVIMPVFSIIAVVLNSI